MRIPFSTHVTHNRMEFHLRNERQRLACNCKRWCHDLRPLDGAVSLCRLVCSRAPAAPERILCDRLVLRVPESRKKEKFIKQFCLSDVAMTFATLCQICFPDLVNLIKNLWGSLPFYCIVKWEINFFSFGWRKETNKMRKMEIN